MSINIMKFLIAAIFLAVGATSLAQAGGFDLDAITTVEGREYQEIFIVDSDEHGLLFRHRRGIAKLPFASLPTNLRMLYEVSAPLEVPDEATEQVGEPQMSPSGQNLIPLVFTVRTRVYPQPAVDSSGYGCGPFLWPSHWPRFHPVHHLVNPYCREMALRDFLYTTGLLPKPPGILTYRLPCNRPWLY